MHRFVFKLEDEQRDGGGQARPVVWPNWVATQ